MICCSLYRRSVLNMLLVCIATESKPDDRFLIVLSRCSGEEDRFRSDVHVYVHGYRF